MTTESKSSRLTIDDMLKHARCDICDEPATRWFGDTAATVCNRQECLDVHTKRFNQALDDLRDIER